MAVGKGGQKGSQSGAQSSQYSGTGTTEGTSSSATNVTGADDYTNYWKQLMGGGGTTPGQDAAGGYYAGQLGYKPPNQFNPLEFFSNAATQTPYTLAQMERQWGDMYQKPANVSATPVSAGTVSAESGANNAAPYMTGYQNDVIDATTGQLLAQRGKDLNSAAMAGTAGGGFLNSRQGLREADVNTNFLRDLASTSAGLRSDAFKFGTGQGQTDATRKAAVEAANADRALGASTFNATQDMGAQQFNSNMANQREQFDSGVATQGQDQRNQAASAFQGIQSGAAGGLGSLGQSQFAQFLAALQGGVPLFGSSTTGSQSGTTTGSGTSSGTSSGNSSSKGGGLSIG